MTGPIIAILILISILLLILLLAGKKNHNPGTSPIDEEQTDGKVSLSTCPLCKTKLQKGELIQSASYPGRNFNVIHIFGCRHCYRDHKKAVEPKEIKKRTCPVCLDTLPPGAHLLAEGTTQKGKHHMHIVGCSLCR